MTRTATSSRALTRQERGPLPARERSSNNPIRVLIAEDLRMVRDALVALLSREPDIEVVADLGRGDEVLAAALRARPAVAVLDFGLSGCDGPTAAAALHERLPECCSIVLTCCCSPASVLRALKAPVRGVIAKDAPATALADGIRNVAAGQLLLSPELTAATVKPAVSPLTTRETEVLRAAQSGISTRDIGIELALSPATVRNYLSNVIAKVGARNRIDAIRIAREAGWL